MNASETEEVRMKTRVVVRLRHGRKSDLWVTFLIHTVEETLLMTCLDPFYLVRTLISS